MTESYYNKRKARLCRYRDRAKGEVEKHKNKLNSMKAKRYSFILDTGLISTLLLYSIREASHRISRLEELDLEWKLYKLQMR